MFERPEGERTYWAVKGKNKGWRKEKKKIPFCRGVSYLFGNVQVILYTSAFMPLK
jgi:hypothetical protein